MVGKSLVAHMYFLQSSWPFCYRVITVNSVTDFSLVLYCTLKFRSLWTTMQTRLGYLRHSQKENNGETGSMFYFLHLFDERSFCMYRWQEEAKIQFSDIVQPFYYLSKHFSPLSKYKSSTASSEFPFSPANVKISLTFFLNQTNVILSGYTALGAYSLTFS